MRDITFEDLFGDAELDMDCPSCNQNFSFKFGEVLDDGSIINCPYCGQEIKIVHDDTTKTSLSESRKSLKDFNQSLKDLERAFKKLGK